MQERHRGWTEEPISSPPELDEAADIEELSVDAKNPRKKRNSLRKAALIGLYSLSMAGGEARAETAPAPDASYAVAEIEQKASSPQAQKRKYATRGLGGTSVNADFRRFFGPIPQDTRFKDKRIYAIPYTIEINFAEQLDRLWREKEGIAPANRVVRAARAKFVGENREGSAGNITVEGNLRDIKSSLDEIKKYIDWQRVRQDMHFDDREFKLFQRMLNNVKAEHLLAYQLTEITPSRDDGDLNLAIFDWMLRCWGKRGVKRIPSFGDDRASIGPYQLTADAIYHT